MPARRQLSSAVVKSVTPMGLENLDNLQSPGAHTPGFMIPPHFGGSKDNT
jgi:hypothetical protein